MADRHSMRGNVGDYVFDTHGQVRIKLEQGRHRVRMKNSQGSEVKYEDNSPYSENGYKWKNQNNMTVMEENRPLITKTISYNNFKIKLTKPEDLENEQENQWNLQENRFEAHDLYNPLRPFQKQTDVGSRQNPLNIPTLVPLPQKNHVLNKPQEYHPIGEPQKKRQYRPVVPKIFKHGYDAYLERINKNEANKNTGEIDLAVMSIEEIVEECQEKRLLPLDIVTVFLNMSGTKQIVKDFIKCWTECKMHQYDFKRSPFTMLDHRRLAELLLHFHPEKYTIGSIDAFHVDSKEFLRKSYFINANEYVSAYLVLDSISGLNWWVNLKNRYRGTVHQNYFTLKEALVELPQPLRLCQNLQDRSNFLTCTLGDLHFQDNDVELQKILTNKFKNPPKFTQKDTGLNEDSRTEMTSQYNDDEMRSEQANYDSSNRRGTTNTNGLYEEQEEDYGFS